MREARLSPLARRQLADIWYFISEKSERAADRIINDILDAIDLAAQNPSMGSPRSDIQKQLRMLVIGSYLVFYRPEAEIIWVAAVVHGMLEPKNWFD